VRIVIKCHDDNTLYWVVLKHLRGRSDIREPAAVGYVRCGGPNDWCEEMRTLKREKHECPGRSKGNRLHKEQHDRLCRYVKEKAKRDAAEERAKRLAAQKKARRNVATGTVKQGDATREDAGNDAKAKKLHLWRVLYDPEVNRDFWPQLLPLWNRTELAKVALAVRILGIKTILVDKLQRLDDNRLVAAMLCDHFHALGATIIEADSGQQLTSKAFFDPILKAAAQHEYHQARRVVGSWKTSVGDLEERLRTGKPTRRGRKRFGSRPEEVAAVKRICELYRVLPKGERNHYRGRKRRSFRQIAQIMNDEGWPTQTGKPWSGTVIRQILKREGKLDMPPANRYYRHTLVGDSSEHEGEPRPEFLLNPQSLVSQEKPAAGTMAEHLKARDKVRKSQG
jgi:hypothetical protein